MSGFGRGLTGVSLAALALAIAHPARAGVISVTNGTLEVTSPAVVGANSVVVDNASNQDAVLLIDSGVTLNNDITLNNGGALTNDGVISRTGVGVEGVHAVVGTGIVLNQGTIDVDDIGVRMDAGGAVTNTGAAAQIDARIGVLMGGSGTVTNSAGASILATDAGLYLQAPASVYNSGAATIVSQDAQGVFMLQGGDVTNSGVGSLIRGGGGDAVSILGAPGTVTNSAGATIDGETDGRVGVLLAAGGSVTNDGAGSLIEGVYRGIDIQSGAGSVTNTNGASITGGSDIAIYMDRGGIVTNGAGSTISGVTGIYGNWDTGYTSTYSITLDNAGTITGTSDVGVDLENGGSITNRAGGSITGAGSGAVVWGGVVTNTGAGTLIKGLGGYGLDLEDVTTLTNAAGAQIVGSDGGVVIWGGSVTNAGSGSLIEGEGGYGVDLADVTTVTNEDGARIKAADAGVIAFAGGSITNQTGGSIFGGNRGVVAWGADILNTGATSTITSDDTAVQTLDGGGSVTNDDGATMHGAVNGVLLDLTSPLINQGGATIIGDQGDGVFSDDGVDVTNQGAGSAISGGANGVASQGGPATVTNQGGATITGGDYGVYVYDAVTIINSGPGSTITGQTQVGVLSANGGAILNEDGGQIVGQTGGVITWGGSVTNTGSGSLIQGKSGYGVDFADVTTLINQDGARIEGSDAGVTASVGGSITNQSAGTLFGGSRGVLASGAVILNSGAGSSISSDDVGVQTLDGGGSLTNADGASIEGANTGVLLDASSPLVNEGGATIVGDQDEGVLNGNGATITNTGADTLIQGHYRGVEMDGGGAIDNADGARIVGVTDVGVYLGAGGAVTNQTGGSIFGGSRGVQGWGAVILNTGAGSTISSDDTAVETFDGGGSVINADGATMHGAVNGVLLDLTSPLINQGGATIIGDQGDGVFSYDGVDVTNQGAGSAIFGGANGVASQDGPATVTNQGGATITGGDYGVYVYDAVTIINSGPGSTITGQTQDGVLSADGGAILNEDGGQIVGQTGGVITWGGSVTNTGADTLIQGHFRGVEMDGGGAIDNADGARIVGVTDTGVFLGAGGAVTNEASASIFGQSSGLYGYGAITVINTGAGSVISGQADVGVGLADGGAVTNSLAATITSRDGVGVYLPAGGSLTNQTGGAVFGGSRGVQGWGAVILNTGAGSTINSDDTAVQTFDGGGSVTNADGAVLHGTINGVLLDVSSPLLNEGGATITADQGDGVISYDGVDVTNTGAGSVIAGHEFGVYTGGASSVVNQDGARISGGEIGVYLLGGGSLNNGAGSTIAGADDGVYATGATVLSNAGTIEGDVELDAGEINHVTLFTGGTIDGALDINALARSTLTLDGAGVQTLSQAVTGQLTFRGALTVQGGGRWIVDTQLAPASTRIANGTLQIGAGGTRGSISGDIIDAGALVFDRSDAATYRGVVSGTGSLTQAGSGVLRLTGASTYTGATTVGAGTLQIDGALGQTTVTVQQHATLSGSGTIGGAVTVASGGILAPGGARPGVLAVGGLTLSDGAALDFRLGPPNSPTTGSDRVDVNGDLTLNGVLNLSNAGGFGAGIYRLFNYTGALTDDGLSIGATPFGTVAADLVVQTSVAHQVNLVDTLGLALSFWDGGLAGNADNSAIDGGNGVWSATAGHWTDARGDYNAAPTGFAVFEGAAGTVTVDGSAGAVGVSGMQFVTSGYEVQGDAITLTAAQTQIRVGDGSDEGAATTATIAASLVGSGGLVKTDLGVLVLTGANSFTGGLTIAAGTLQVGDGGTSGSIPGDVVDNGVLAFDRSDVVTFRGTISGSGAVRQAGPGVLTLTGSNSYTGGTVVSAGSLAGTATSFGSGAIVDDAILVIDQATDGVFANALGGSGAFVKRGVGAVELTGDDDLSGPTTIEGGQLIVSGRLGRSVVTVESGATLGGAGVVDGVAAQSGGVVAPAGGLGVLTVDGDYGQAAGSILRVSVTRTGQAGAVKVSGAASLADGALLAVDRLDDGPYVAGTRYTVLTAGAVGGNLTLAGDARLSAFLGMAVTGDSRDVYLDIVQNRRFAAAAVSGNQHAVADGVNSLPTVDPLFVALANLPSDDEARGAFDQLSGDVYGSIRAAAVEDSRFARDAAIGRVRAASEDGADGGSALWGQGFGSWGSAGGDGAAGLSRSIGGFFIGGDAPVAGGARLGMLAGYSRTSLDRSAGVTLGWSDTYQLGAYGGGRWDHVGVRAGIVYALSRWRIGRQVSFSGFQDHLSSTHDTDMAQVFGDVGYRLRLGGAAVEPFGSLAYISLGSRAFAEAGGASALQAQGERTGVAITTLGLRQSYGFNVGKVTVTANGSVGWRRAFGATTPAATLAFSGGADFTVDGAPIARDSLAADFGLAATLDSSLSFSLSYSGQLAAGARDNGVKGAIDWRF